MNNSTSHFPSESPAEKVLDGLEIYRIAFGRETKPDLWQQILMDEKWPQVLIAPTGSGKTAAITLGWVAHRLRSPRTTPRRLVWCLPMRTLVEQTADAVKNWFGRLATHLNDATNLPSLMDVHVLMGGVEVGDWLTKPECPAVLIGTQDMLLSRALMRGYATSRANWPMEFALLHDDTQWVFDEVQLMGAGRSTSAQLEAFRRCEAVQAAKTNDPYGRPARSLWVSATLEPAWLKTVDHPEPPPNAVVRIDPNAAVNGRLTLIAKAQKVLRRSDVAPMSGKSEDVKRYIAEFAKSILATHRPGQMTLVIVNRVARAQALHEAIKQLLTQRVQPSLALVHSRFRPVERRRQMNKVLGGESNDIIVVSTQAVEAGLDISAAVMFTELAPWSSMVQRFGRANRYAEIVGGAEIHWIDLLGEDTDEKAESGLAQPYETEEMRSARKRLVTLTSVSPVSLPPPDSIDATWRVVRRKDLDDLFDTDPDLTGFDVDISPYVRDADDTDVQLFWRDLRGSHNPDQVSPWPRADELCAAPISGVKHWLKKTTSRKQFVDLVFIRDPQWHNTNSQKSLVLRLVLFVWFRAPDHSIIATYSVQSGDGCPMLKFVHNTSIGESDVSRPDHHQPRPHSRRFAGFDR